jgi:hypothetical protein
MTNFSKLKNKFEKALKNNFQENIFMKQTVETL